MGKGAATKQAIIERAMGVASTVGLEGLSIGTLSKTLGLSKSGLFAHFRSKETLQIEVIAAAETYFVQKVIRPAIRAPRGEPRARQLFENWLAWSESTLPGGCLFVAAATEYDDRPGPVREVLVKAQSDWIQTLTRSAKIAQDEGHFRVDLDPRQFAFDFNAITLSAHYFRRLLESDDSFAMARRSFESLVIDARA